MNTTETLKYDRLEANLNELQRAWKWFAGLGTLTLLVGFIAFGNHLLASVASVLLVGTLMIFTGVAQIIEAFQVGRSGGFVFWLLGGLIYSVAGIFAFANPLLAAGLLTLMLAISLIVVGALRLFYGIRTRRIRGSGWVSAAGILTILVGAIIAIGWPTNAVWVLGIFLAVDLTFTGAALLILGLALRADRGVSRTAREALRAN